MFENNIAYCSGEAGYVIWDCSDVDNITYLGSLDDGSNYNHSSWKHTQYTSVDTQYFMWLKKCPLADPLK